jgi:hypothetical protein
MFYVETYFLLWVKNRAARASISKYTHKAKLHLHLIQTGGLFIISGRALKVESRAYFFGERGQVCF